MSLKKVTESLHRLERRVLPVLERASSVEEVAHASNLSVVEVVRAVQWLEKKGAVSLKTDVTDVLLLGDTAKQALSKGLPERRLLESLKTQELPISKISVKTGLSRDEANAALGSLRSSGAVILRKDKELIVVCTAKGRSLLEQGFSEESFLKKQFPLSVASLSSKDIEIISSLKKRKGFLIVEKRKSQLVLLEPIGRDLLKAGVLDDSMIDSLTSQVLKSKSWEGKTFRRFDVDAVVPRLFGGKHHVYRSFLDSVRKKFLSLGFSEMNGSLVESEFWNMDSLFMPQFHSARDIHDVYYVADPTSLRVDPVLVQKVKKAHEQGIAGSRGWRYPFDSEKTLRAVLRSQGTACSSKMLASHSLQIPGKYFGITRVFRKDVIDATHLSDFNQTEGFVIGEHLTLRHLVGLLKMFAREFAGAEEIRVVPGYFPFTEPSLELFAKHPVLGWVELGGAGIFRPEVVVPLLGKDVSVLAWGIGIDRLAMFKLGLTDIRQLFSQDLEFLRTSRVI